jgi:hypothetical protein
MLWMPAYIAVPNLLYRCRLPTLFHFIKWWRPQCSKGDAFYTVVELLRKQSTIYMYIFLNAVER